MSHVELAKDELLKKFGITLQDEQLMINLAGEKDWDHITEICLDQYPSLKKNDKLHKASFERLKGQLIELIKDKQSNRMFCFICFLLLM